MSEAHAHGDHAHRHEHHHEHGHTHETAHGDGRGKARGGRILTIRSHSDARRDNPASSGVITSTKTELQILQ